MNLNKVFIIGRLTQEPETRSTTSGQNVTTLNMATNRVWTDKSGQKQEAAEYHRVVAWGRLGDIASQYLRKGGLVLIEGRLQTRSWTDQAGNKKYTTEIIAEGLQLGPRTAGTASSDYQQSRPAVGDLRKSSPSPVKDADIPIIGEDEPLSAGVDEDEVKVNEKDLPF